MIPPELIGTWETADPRYEERSFELTTDRIILALGEDGKKSYLIERFEKSQEFRATTYTLTYTNLVEGASDTVAFYYEPRDGGVIRFKNQQKIEWKKGATP